MSGVSVYNLKPRFQKILRPSLNWLVQRKITANMISVVALMGSMVVGYLPTATFYKLRFLLIFALWLLIRMALNAIDGMLAREFNMASRKGFFLNEAGDIISDMALYFPLAFLAPDALLEIGIFCMGAIFTEFFGVLPKAFGAGRHYEGPMGKSDRALWVGLLAILTVFFSSILAYWRIIFMVMIILEAVTCYNRIRGGLQDSKVKAEGKG